uniref:Nitrogenase n=1 Tax=Brugia timori TaxID=42155 RepID=A0A0R3R366_9BILA
LLEFLHVDIQSTGQKSHCVNTCGGHHNALANPYPEVTDLICRLPLPTLIYRLETLNLGDLLRIRYKLLGVCVPQSSIFKVQEENIDTAI